MNDHNKTLEWLQQLKAGDEVVLHSGGAQFIRAVMRVTPKQVFVNIGDYKEYEQAFWKRDGQEVGSASSWRGKIISMPDPATVQRILDRQKLKSLRDWLSRSQFNLEQLRAMKTAYDELNTLATKIA